MEVIMELVHPGIFNGIVEALHSYYNLLWNYD